jgi:hypothetical protein
MIPQVRSWGHRSKKKGFVLSGYSSPLHCPILSPPFPGSAWLPPGGAVLRPSLPRLRISASVWRLEPPHMV